MDDIYLQGYAAYNELTRNGIKAINPHERETAEYREWDEGYCNAALDSGDALLHTSDNEDE